MSGVLVKKEDQHTRERTPAHANCQAKVPRKVHAPPDVVRYMSVPQLLHHPLDLSRREIELKAHRRIRPRLGGLCEKVDPLELGDKVLYHSEVRLRARDRCAAPADALHPAQRVEAVLHAELQRRVRCGEAERAGCKCTCARARTTTKVNALMYTEGGGRRKDAPWRGC